MRPGIHRMAAIFISNYQQKAFEISNTAAEGPLDQEKLFKRFSKVGQTTDHHGLGLSIVKQIADVSGMNISYRFSKGNHIFSVHLNQSFPDL